MAKNDDWTDEELVASVDAYREMQRLDAARTPYVKAHYYRALSERFKRSEGSFETRMQNISHVLEELGQERLPGLAPRANVGANIRTRLLPLLTKAARRRSKAMAGAAYKEKLPAIRDWLIAIARTGGKVTYGQVMSAFDVDRFSLRHGMESLGKDSRARGEPVITALIVNKRTGRSSIGIDKAFHVQDDQAERERLYAFWRDREQEFAHSSRNEQSGPAKAARFASVEVRPDQAAFRYRVFEANGGKCVLSGCDVSEALDAAHKHGRSWRLGRNEASDGYVMRKDLHALYDADLLRISEEGVVQVDEDIRDHYGYLEHVKVAP